MTATEKYLARIQALLTKAERGATPEEARSLVAKAQELMVKYAIDEAMLAQARPAEREAPTTLRIPILFSPYQTPKIELLDRVARSQGCRAVFQGGYTQRGWGTEVEYLRDKHGQLRKGKTAIVVGFPSSLKFVEMLYTSLLLQAEQEFQAPDVQERLFAETDHPGHRIKWRNDFALAYAYRIGARLAETKRDVVASSGKGELVLARDQQVEAHVGELFPKLGTLKARAGGYGGSGYGMGRAAAERADLGAPRVGGSRKEIR
jgi:hypothetical protein